MPANVFQRLKQLLRLLICLPLAAAGQVQFKGSRENLGKEVNDEFDQVRPVFSADGSTLYFAQGSGKNLQYEVWRTLADSMGRLTGKQSVKALNPITSAPKFILQAPSSHRILVNGVYHLSGSNLQYSRGVSAIDLPRAGEVFTPAQFQKQNNRVLDSLFRKRTIYPLYHALSRAYYWSDDADDGQSDIYFLPYGKDSSVPIKLPAIINTKWNEQTPWMDEEGHWLYFSSNRPGGFGETDIWAAERLDDSFQKWGNPVNLGPVVNTAKSESCFIIDPGNVYAYLASDKNGFGRNDLYRIALRPPDSAAGASALLLPADRPDTSLLLLPETHASSNIVFLLDISHSMAQSRKMVLLKKAMYRLAQQLRPSDRISLVTFGGSVELLLSPQYIKSKANIIDAIQLLSANGGATHISSGLQRAYQQADELFLPKGNNQLLLVTDGVFTLKPADEALVLKHSNILLTAVVVGNDEAVSTALAPLVQKASGQLIRLNNENTDLNLLLQNVRTNARLKK